MTKHELASFALKLLGIYTFTQALPIFQILGTLVYMQRHTDEALVQFWASALMLVPFLLMAAASAVLVVFSRNLAALLVGEDSPLSTSSTLTSRDVQAIGFSIVAVLIFLGAIPQFTHAVRFAFYAISQDYSEPAMSQTVQNALRYGIPAVIQLVLAIVLFLQARGLANLWHRIRTGGQAKIDDAGQ